MRHELVASSRSPASRRRLSAESAFMLPFVVAQEARARALEAPSFVQRGVIGTGRS